MAIFISYWGQCISYFSDLFHPRIANPTSGPLHCLRNLQGRLKLTKYHVKYLSIIYEYLPIENNSILVNNSLILTNMISYKIVRDIYAF